MRRLNRLPNILFPISVILTLSSCAQQGEIKEPFEIAKRLDSSDYKGEIRSFKEPVVLRRLPYEQRSTNTTRITNKANIPAVSTMKISRTSQRVTYPEEQLAAITIWILGGESKSSKEPSTQWQYRLKLSFVLDLSDFSVSDRDYPVLGSTEEQQRQVEKGLDTFFDAFRQFAGLEDTYFGQPISDENNEFLFDFALAISQFDIESNFKGKMTAVGMTTYLGYDAVVMDISMTATSSNNVFARLEGYAVVSARDGATLFSKLVSHSYQGSEHGRLLNEGETTIVADNYVPTPTSTAGIFRDDALRAYLRFDDVSTYKVFLQNEEGAWAWTARESFYSAWRQALQDCHQQAKAYGLLGECRVYAAGDDIVWDMSKTERDAVIKAYSE